MPSRIASTTRMAPETSTYSYDFPVPSSSMALPPSPKSPLRKLPRPSSPFSQIHTPHVHLPHTHHHHHSSKYSPSSRASDINRLLDPSYTRPSSATANASPASAYVDHKGHLHDPDYRHFPAVTRPRWEAVADDATDEDSFAMYGSGTREYDSHHSYNDDAVREYEDDDDVYRSSSRHSWDAHSARRRSTSRHRDSGASSSYRTATTATASDSLYAYRPAAAYFASSPTSFGSDETVLTVEEDEEEKDKHSSLRKYRLCSRTRSPREERKRLPTEIVDEEKKAEEQRIERDAEEEEDEENDREENDEDVDAEQMEWTPTCSQSLRKQWQSISLRFRFGVFRAQRSVRQRVRRD